MFHPSAVDDEATIAYARRTVEIVQSHKTRMEEKLNNFGESGMNSRENIGSARLTIKRWETKIDAAKSADRQIGRGFASSGCEVLPGYFPEGGCRIDWGLAELTAGRIGTNKVSYNDGRR